MTQKEKIKVFIADDDDDDIMLFKEAIEIAGINASLTSFKHGKALSDHIHQNENLPDLVFLDINMPLMNGIECLKDIRQTQYFHNVPVVMYSTSYHPDHIKESFNCFANLYITKPSSLNELVSTIKTVFELYLNGNLMKVGRADFDFKR